MFGRDMILNIKHEANWEYIRKRKQTLIEKNNKHENKKEFHMIIKLVIKSFSREGMKINMKHHTKVPLQY